MTCLSELTAVTILFQIHQSANEFMFKTVSMTRRLDFHLAKSYVSLQMASLSSDVQTSRYDPNSLFVIVCINTRDIFISTTSLQSLKKILKEIEDAR